jgi:hypothetical protein
MGDLRDHPGKFGGSRLPTDHRRFSSKLHVCVQRNLL